MTAGGGANDQSHPPVEQGPSDTLEMSLCCLQAACSLKHSFW